MKGIEPKATAIKSEQLDIGSAIRNASKIEWPKEKWWEQYHDSQLNQLITKAISKNPDLKAAQSRIDLAQAYADVMQAKTKPTIGGNISMSREHFTSLQFIPPPWAGHTYWNNLATASMAYDLDLWGQQESVWKAALDETHATAAEAQQVKLELATAIVKIYVSLSSEHALRDIAILEEEDAKHKVTIANRAYHAGLATEIEVAELESALPIAKNKVEQFDARIAVLSNQLAALSGEGPGAGEHIARPSLTYEVVTGLPESLPANLIARRPDIAASKWRIEASKEYVQSAKATFYPNINLLSFIGLQAIGFSQLFTSAATMAGIGPAISLPIYDGGQRRGNLSAQTAAYDISVHQYNATVLKAFEDISKQLVLLNSNANELKNAEEALAKAERAHSLAQKSYQAGLSNFSKCLETNELMLKQREAIIELQMHKLTSHADLMLALGGSANEVTREQQPLALP